MNFEKSKDALLAWAKHSVFLRRVRKAEDLIQEALAMSNNPCVAFSAGKDSSVMAHMVAKYKHDIPLRIITGGETRFKYKNFDEVLNWWRSEGYTVVERNYDRVFTPEWIDKSWEEQRIAGTPDLRHDNPDFDCVFLGIRAEESNIRKISLAKCRTPGLPRNLYRTKIGNLRCCPVGDWDMVDIAAYMALHDLPLLDWYSDFGIDQRTSTRIRNGAVRSGSLTLLKMKDPAAFNKITERFPELKHFI